MSNFVDNDKNYIYFIIDIYKCFMNLDVVNFLDIVDELNLILIVFVLVISY